MKLCTKCQTPITRSPHVNNIKYCIACRAEAYTGQYGSPQHAIGKPQCFICKLHYKKPISHAWQVHGVHEREHVKNNYAVVVVKNLLKDGVNT